ncbi:hypothetical protein MKK68_00395 [Methylobacterium sp. E-016]|uniref:hypothetical protein n=1 Tax=Methylobacterium sp. E-016 TaxID=2836556 RepID=UPI001FB9866E|nr:hypothetical protein [Methylobacterium sp. E-016]MCJ2074122.1 hypothetical protein [Methylobacterium sp. E-016]
MDDEGKAIAEASADAELARSQLQQTERYLTRGRLYRDMPEADLALVWVAGMQEYARVIHPRPQSVDDAAAEFGLRGIEPPWHAVQVETEHLRVAAEAAFKSMTEDEKHAAGSDMIETYLAEMDALQ